jgi:CheY-like chemotaxis protein
MDTTPSQGRPAGAPGGPGMHILVVDDYPTTAESLALLLRLYGYQVTVALDGWTARRLAQAGRPDVVLCDLDMPGILCR